MGSGKPSTTRHPSASRKGGAPHEARGPDVAVDPSLVTEAVGEPGLAKQFVKFVSVGRRDQGANFGSACIDVRGGLSLSGDSNADGPEKCVR